MKTATLKYLRWKRNVVIELLVLVLLCTILSVLFLAFNPFHKWAPAAMGSSMFCGGLSVLALIELVTLEHLISKLRGSHD